MLNVGNCLPPFHSTVFRVCQASGSVSVYRRNWGHSPEGGSEMVNRQLFRSFLSLASGGTFSSSSGYHSSKRCSVYRPFHVLWPVFHSMVKTSSGRLDGALTLHGPTVSAVVDSSCASLSLQSSKPGFQLCKFWQCSSLLSFCRVFRL